MERLSNRLHLVGELLSLTHAFSPHPLGIGVGGQFAVLSSSNRLFYGTLSYGSAIEVRLACIFSSRDASYHCGIVDCLRCSTR